MMHFYSSIFRLVLYKHAFLKLQLPIEWQCLNPEGGNVRTQIIRRPVRGASPTQPQPFLYLLPSDSGFCEHHSKQDRVVLKKTRGTVSYTQNAPHRDKYILLICCSVVLIPGCTSSRSARGNRAGSLMMCVRSRSSDVLLQSFCIPHSLLGLHF